VPAVVKRRVDSGSGIRGGVERAVVVDGQACAASAPDAGCLLSPGV